MATPPAALPPQGRVSSARFLRSPHPLGGCLPPGHRPLLPSSCWSGGLVGPSSRAPRSQPCVLGSGTLGSTGWPRRGAARPGAPGGGLGASAPGLQGLRQQRRTPCWWLGFWKTLELHTLERCRRWGGGWQWGTRVPPRESAVLGPHRPPLLAVSQCLSCGFPDADLWVGDGMLGSGPPDPGPCRAVAAAFIWGSEGCPTRTTLVPSLARKDLPTCSWHRSQS